ncbi:MAG TPA: thiamine pyrophosphate-dependent dehydrogenase E1 component subunit alpha [Gemmatimonadales bacterium]|nr:thiamine pyrophosphate-dependent dehydrogenase E1 component subunit alpha [Gemmatimonadales bacterium]
MAARVSAPAAPGDAATAASIPVGLTREQLLEMYRYLRLTRSLEERLTALYRQGKVIGGLFRSLGQEGESVASAFALERGEHKDFLSPLIRNLGAMLVMGAKPVEILRQYMAKATSPTVGRELNVHFGDLVLGFLGQISHLGDMIPVMAGIALSFKLRGEPRVALVYIGDGGMSTGTFHEGLSFAAVQRVPLVVIGEYNQWAYSTPPERQFAAPHLADRVKPYGIHAETIDGNDVLEVYATTKAAVARARSGAGVQFIEVKTYRRKGHAEHDNQSYVPPGEIDRWAKDNDPIDRYAKRIVERGWTTAPALTEIDRAVAAEIDAALASCIDDPLPAAASALPGVLTQPGAAPLLWYRRL